MTLPCWTLSDVDVLAAVAEGSAATYVLRNRLSTYRPCLSTQRVLRALKRLESLGQVRRAPSSYKKMICWKHA